MLLRACASVSSISDTLHLENYLGEASKCVEARDGLTNVEPDMAS